MQFIAKDLLTLDLDGTPNDSSATWLAERALLAADSLRASGRLRLRVRGASMLPTLWPGDVVEIAGCSPDDVRLREIVLALRAERFFLHRVVGRSPAGGIWLRGDSMPAADPEFSNEELLGKLAGGPRPLSVWSWAVGRVLCHCAPVRRLALRVHENPPPVQSISELPSAGA